MKGSELREKIEGIKGRIIGQANTIDLLLSYIISYYVSPKHKKDLDIVMFLCNKSNMRNKLQIFEFILKQEPKFEEMAYSNISKEIDAIQNRRSLFAHSMPKITDSEIYDQKFVDLYTSNSLGKAIERYDLNQYESDLDKCRRIVSALMKIYGALAAEYNKE